MLYPTSPTPWQPDPVGPHTIHLYLLIINFHTHVFYTYIHNYTCISLCVKLFAIYIYMCSRDQLEGASDSLALRSRDGSKSCMGKNN